MSEARTNVERELASIRDTVESVAVAIVLALVLRAFIFEAFVIPTGSMAPRLLGRHWPLQCPSCGFEYDFGYSHDRLGMGRPRGGGAGVPKGAACPSCGQPGPSRSPLRGGDRVLVMKYLYRFAEPRAWDVVVFKNPQDNRQNYIKRLVGLPGETIEIVHGDIFVRDEEGQWRIRRKPRYVQETLWQVIFDNDYPPSAEWMATGRSPHWARKDVADSRWNLTGAGGRVFTFEGGEDPAGLVLKVSRGDFLPHYGYNSRSANQMDEDLDVCSDLKLSLLAVPSGSDTRLALTVGGLEHLFRAEILADGSMVLRARHLGGGGWEEWDSKKRDPLEIGRGYQVALTHVDYQVTLWVDGEAVLQSPTSRYQADHAAIKKRMQKAYGLKKRLFQSADRDRDQLRRKIAELIPTPRVRIDARGGGCKLRQVRVLRDVHYTSPLLRDIEPGPLGAHARSRQPGVSVGQKAWGTIGNPISLRRDAKDHDLDEFFVLGDNSPQSHDGRTWTSAAPTLRLVDEDGRRLYQLGTVPRYSLIGRAFFVYWPAGFRVPGLPGLPLIPNFGRMRFIR